MSLSFFFSFVISCFFPRSKITMINHSNNTKKHINLHINQQLDFQIFYVNFFLLFSLKNKKTKTVYPNQAFVLLFI